MPKFKFKLGTKAVDTVSGFEGTIIARNEWLNGCIQYCLKPVVDKDGKLLEGEWFDENQVKVRVTAGSGAKVRRPTGGPQKDAPRA